MLEVVIALGQIRHDPCRNTPKRVLDTPELVLDTPGRVLDTPKRVLLTPSRCVYEALGVSRRRYVCPRRVRCVQEVCMCVQEAVPGDEVLEIEIALGQVRHDPGSVRIS
jgi:hypothetical protein